LRHPPLENGLSFIIFNPEYPMRFPIFHSLLFVLCLNASLLVAQETPLAPKVDKPLINDVELPAQLHAKFKKLLTGAKLRGQFTVDGRPLNNLQEEAYDIEKVEKLPEGDTWVITTRIKYGTHDLTVPVPLEVKWAGTTPVLTLDDLTIPGLGTFGARVVLHKDKYAGTWQHDAVGGHLFGAIELAKTDGAVKTPSAGN
jgi:hypothetical protein